MSKKKIYCPFCKSDETVKNGHGDGVQRYMCHVCNRRFRSKRRTKNKGDKYLWCDYIFHKQTIRELSDTYNIDRRIVRKHLDEYIAPEKVHNPRAVHLLVDATYFGERKEGLLWCVLVARDGITHEDLYWLFADSETTYGYSIVREKLEELGYNILSVTGDGFGGIKSAFFGISYQMCHVHMERIVTKGTTQNPKTEEGQVLLALVRTLHQKTDSHTFHIRLKKYFELCENFLNKKTFNEESGRWDWTHRSLRKAALSLKKHEKYLFTFEHNKNIPKTTNSLEGHFSHIKRYLGDHRGVSKTQAKKILQTLFLASTVSPDKKILHQIL